MGNGEPVLLSRRVLIYYLATFLLLAIGEALGYLLTISGVSILPKSTLQELEQLAQNPSYIAIFSHNAEIDVLMNIPFIGPVLYVAIIGFTGLALGYIVVTKYGVSLLYLIVAYFSSAMMPHGWLELFAYSLSAYNSVSVTIDVVRHRYVGRSLAYWVIRLVLSVAILLPAAYIEYIELKSLGALAHA